MTSASVIRSWQWPCQSGDNKKTRIEFLVELTMTGRWSLNGIGGGIVRTPWGQRSHYTIIKSYCALYRTWNKRASYDPQSCRETLRWNWIGGRTWLEDKLRHHPRIKKCSRSRSVLDGHCRGNEQLRRITSEYLRTSLRLHSSRRVYVHFMSACRVTEHWSHNPWLFGFLQFGASSKEDILWIISE